MAGDSLALQPLEGDPSAVAPRWRDGWRLFRRHRLATAGLVVVVVLAVLAASAPLLTRWGVLADPLRQHVENADAGFSLQHLLGTDDLGRDLLSRTIYAGQISLSIGLLVQGVVLVIGGTVGMAAGYAGGRVDNLLMRLTDIMYAFPGLLFVLFIVSLIGPGYRNLFVAVGVVNWVGMARLVRGQVLALKEREFVEAARAAGAGPLRIIVRHLIPNCLGPVVVTLAFGVPGAIFIEAFLSFIGVGIRPPTPSWGVMVNEGYQDIFAYPQEVIVPVVAIALATLSFNFIGDGLRDSLDPRMHR